LSTEGEPIITSYFNSDTLRFGPLEIYNQSTSYNIFVTKYGANGTPLFARAYGGTGIGTSTSIIADTSDNLYICGYFYSPTLSIGTTTLTNPGVSNGYLAKLGPTGIPAWAITVGDAGF